MNDIVVFIGPSITKAEALKHLDAVFLAPAKQGDVYAAYLQYKPAAIGMIDGHFENVPAPWHKEILWVMAQGVKVYGASSMGALRAAELHSFGMIGVGEIFEDYKSGLLEDDDEVAVIHGPAELGYPVLSEAMASIRKTLAAAHAQSVIGKDVYDAALSIAKSLFYRDRTYSNILEKLKASDAKDLSAWLEQGKIDLKKQDAIELLRRMKIDQPFRQHPVSYEFEDTEFWRAMKQEIDKDLMP